MKPLTWTIEEVDVSLLRGYTKNPRSITDTNLELLKQSVETFGQVVPLIVNQDYTVLGGNQRMQVMSGMVKVSVPSRMLSAQEEAELCIVLNNKVGDWDFAKLDALGWTDDMLIQEFGFDSQWLAKNRLMPIIEEDEVTLDDGFTPKEENDPLVKVLRLSFKGISDEELTHELENLKLTNKVDSFEDLLLKKVRNYQATM